MICGKLTGLRAADPEDVNNWVKWFNDKEVTQYLARIYPYNLEEARQYFQKVQQNPAEKLYSIVDLQKGRHIGSVSLRNIDWRNRHAELGVLVGDKEYTGRGYGQDAVRTLCRFAFREMNLNRVYLYVRADHNGGIRSYNKVGFRQEGILRRHLYRDGAYHDMIIMGLLVEDLKE